MNSSETTTELSNVPDSYQIEVKASPKFNDINFNLIGNDTATQLNNDTFTFQGNKIVVRPEEALIVIFVLILWMAAIGLFFHRWGKIRNCEPYTPKFEAEDHRNSCHDQTNLISKRMSMSNKLSTPGPLLPLTSNPHSFSKELSVHLSTSNDTDSTVVEKN
ncbi:hypothetical protein ACKWTF_006766 [Chironomus riparius]